MAFSFPGATGHAQGKATSAYELLGPHHYYYQNKSYYYCFVLLERFSTLNPNPPREQRTGAEQRNCGFRFGKERTTVSAKAHQPKR